MSSAKVSSQGRVVIPRDIRQALGIRQGDVLEFALEGSGSVSIRVTGRIPLETLKGAWKRAGDPHLSDEEIARAIREAAGRRHA